MDGDSGDDGWVSLDDWDEKSEKKIRMRWSE